MRRMPIILTIIAIVLVFSLKPAKSLIYGDAPLIQLKGAPALSGQISQALASSDGNQLTLPTYGTDYTLKNTRYFENNTWVVTTITPLHSDMNSGVVVLKKEAGVYTVVLGPGSAFSRSITVSLPDSLGRYLNQQGYLYDSAE